MKSKQLEEFMKYVKEQFGYEIILKPGDLPDDFERIFGVSFLKEDGDRKK